MSQRIPSTSIKLLVAFLIALIPALALRDSARAQAGGSGPGLPVDGTTPGCDNFRAAIDLFLFDISFDISDEGWVWVEPVGRHFRSVSERVTKSKVADGLFGPREFALIAATSSEPDTDPASGDFPGDIQDFVIGASDISGRVHAERSGAGPGRVYTLGYRGSDLAGNSVTCAPTVVVPHDQSAGK